MHVVYRDQNAAKS